MTDEEIRGELYQIILDLAKLHFSVPLALLFLDLEVFLDVFFELLHSCISFLEHLQQHVLLRSIQFLVRFKFSHIESQFR